MIIITIVVAVGLILSGVAGASYAGVRLANRPHRPALISAVASMPLAGAALLLLIGQPDLATGLGYLLGAIGLCGCTWWLWQRRPVAQLIGAPADHASWNPASTARAERVQAGMKNYAAMGYRKVDA